MSFTEEERFILQRRRFEITDDRDQILTLKCPACGGGFTATPADEPHEKTIHVDGGMLAVEGCKCGHVACIKDKPYARNETLLPELRPFVDER